MPPTTPRSMATVLNENIQALVKLRQSHLERRSAETKAADEVTSFAGSMKFLYLHLIWFGGWIVCNVIDIGLPRFDPYPFGLLTMVVSLEAIFLSTIVMISQNRIAAHTEEKADLDLEINLLAEHEITRLLRMTEAIARKLGIEDESLKNLSELETDVVATEIVNEIHRQLDSTP
jgi:uncharacterized membrane protein